MRLSQKAGIGKILCPSILIRIIIEPETAIYTPAHILHKVDVDPDQDLTYVVIYAPPGPEQQLKQRGARAFDERA